MRIRKKSVKISSNPSSVNMTTQDLDLRTSKTYFKIFIRKHLVISQNANLTFKRKGGRKKSKHTIRGMGEGILFFLGGRGGGVYDCFDHSSLFFCGFECPSRSLQSAIPCPVRFSGFGNFRCFVSVVSVS